MAAEEALYLLFQGSFVHDPTEVGALNDVAFRFNCILCIYLLYDCRFTAIPSGSQEVCLCQGIVDVGQVKSGSRYSVGVYQCFVYNCMLCIWLLWC